MRARLADWVDVSDVALLIYIFLYASHWLRSLLMNC